LTILSRISILFSLSELAVLHLYFLTWLQITYTSSWRVLVGFWLFCLVDFLWDSVSLHSPDWTHTCHGAQASFELGIILPQPPKCWHYRHLALYPNNIEGFVLVLCCLNTSHYCHLPTAGVTGMCHYTLPLLKFLQDVSKFIFIKHKF
jgi:hypothetical protein